MKFKDRIKSFRRIKASDLKTNSKNWRLHPESQSSALRAVLDEVGFASACLVRECKNGTFELIDGHLRADLAEDAKIPCLILDVTKQEADKLLATFDPLTSMAEIDKDAYEELLRSIETTSEELAEVLSQMSVDAGIRPEDIEFKEYTEEVADEVKMIQCPECGHEFPK